MTLADEGCLAVRLVLMRPRTSENLGAAARAMRNFGLRDWVWVQPAVEDLGPARRMAVHASDLLDTARVEASLEQAVAGCVWVVGTSSRHVVGQRRLSPRAVARELVERRAQGTAAVVFGDERNGLSNEEVARCHALSAAPTSPEQPSINLAQSVLLYAYELRMAQLEAGPTRSGALPTAATTDELGQVGDLLRATLRDSGFLRGPERHAVRDLMAPLIRSHLTRKEAHLWQAALHTLRSRMGASD